MKKPTIYVYKIPGQITKEEVLALTGANGNLLNPLHDADGNLVISQEEFNAEEFQQYKETYKDIIDQFELIEYKPDLNLIAP